MARARIITLLLLIGVLVQSVLPSAGLNRAYAMPAEPDSVPPAARPKLDPLPPARTSHVPLQQAPLAFEPNVGQSDPVVRFLLQAPGSTIFFTPAEAVFVLSVPGTRSAVPPQPSSGKSQLGASNAAPANSGTPSPVVRLQWVNAATPTFTSTLPLPGRINYFLGNDPSKWHTDIPTYASIMYTGIYSGVNLVYETVNGNLKGTYQVAPQADPNQIRWRYAGITTATVDAQGNLQLALTTGVQASVPITLTEQAPVAWQAVNGQQTPVSARYTVAPDGTVGFALGTYDPAQPLILDPTLTYSTFLGGSNDDGAANVAVDGSGNAYVTGYTTSTNFPHPGFLTPETSSWNAYVAKLNVNGNQLVYSTIIGGSEYDESMSIAVDGVGDAYITGQTYSADFPVSTNAFQTDCRHNAANCLAGDVFVCKLNPNGDALDYSTFYGGAGRDYAGNESSAFHGQTIAVDTNGDVYITGTTNSHDLVLPYGFQPVFAGFFHAAFMVKIHPDPAINPQLLYGTYIAGNYLHTYGHAIAVDGAKMAYIVGQTDTDNDGGNWHFPITTDTAFQLRNPLRNGTGFLTKVDPEQQGTASLIYSSFLGGTTGSAPIAVAVNRTATANFVYVSGWTRATDFPGNKTPGAYRTMPYGGEDAYAVKMDLLAPPPSTNQLLYGTYLGGGTNDQALGVAYDTVGDIYVTGYTESTDFPLQDPIPGQDRRHGNRDAFVARLHPDRSLPAGQQLIYSTYLGGDSVDAGRGIAVDGMGSAYVVGYTTQTFGTQLPFPTVNPYQGTNHGGGDSFVSKLGPHGQTVDCTGEELLGAAATCAVKFAGVGINTLTGNFWYTGPGVGVDGHGGGLAFVPSYNAQANLPPEPWQRPLGAGWTHSYNLWVSHDSLTYYVHLGDGSVLPFPDSGQAPARLGATFGHMANPSRYVMELTHGHTQYRFDDADFSPTRGQLLEIVTREGFVTKLSYNANDGSLAKVTEELLYTHPFPVALRWLQFDYSSGHLTTVTLHTGEPDLQVSFCYTGLLCNSGSGVLFKLTAVTDEAIYFDSTSAGRVTTYLWGHGGGQPVRGRLDTDFDTSVTPRRVGSQKDQLNRELRVSYPSGTRAEVQIKNAQVPQGQWHTTQYNYDADRTAGGRIHTVVLGSQLTSGSETWSYDYSTDFPMGVEWVTDPQTYRWHTVWDPQGNITQTVDPENQTVGYDYDSNNDLYTVTASTAQSGHRTTTYNRGLYGRVNSTTQSASGVLISTSYTYGDARFPTSPTKVTDPLTHDWQSTYDSYGYLHTTIRPQVGSERAEQRTTTVHYDTRGDLREVDEPWQWDAQHGNEVLHITRYEYENDGQLRNVKIYPDPAHVDEAHAAKTQYHYDTYDRLSYVCDASVTNCGLIPVAQRTTTRYDYYNDNQIQKVTDGEGYHTDYEYNTPTGQISKLIDPNGHPTTYTYDDFDRLQAISNAYNHSARYTYYDDGTLHTLVDENNQTTTYSYKHNNQIETIDYASATPDVNFTYYPNGLQHVMTTGTGANAKLTTYIYDWLDRPTSVTNGANQTVGYVYDDNSNLTRITYPTASNLYVDQIPDEANRLKTLDVRRPNGTQLAHFNFTYYDSGRLYLQSTSTAFDTFSYDGAGRLTGDHTTFTHDQDRDFGYGWTPNGDVLAADDVSLGVTTHHDYSYDYASHVRDDSATILETGQGESRSYDYYAGGNIHTAHFVPYFNPLQSSLSVWTYGNTNELQTLKQNGHDYGYTFDDNGNRKNKHTASAQNTALFSYTYDQANRLTATGGHDNYFPASYSYDGDGLRTQKTVTFPADISHCPPAPVGCSSPPSPDIQTTDFTWNVVAGTPLLLQEQQYINETFSGQASYVYGPLGVLAQVTTGRYMLDSAVGQKSTKEVPETITGSAIYYYHLDQLGSVRLLSDSSGHVVSSYTYDPYGQRISTKNGPPNPFGFAGEYRDEESQLLYLRARYYDPATQQFLTRDPVDAVHPYIYGNGNPLNATDPTGHEPGDPEEQWEQSAMPLPSAGSVSKLNPEVLESQIAAQLNDLPRYGSSHDHDMEGTGAHTEGLFWTERTLPRWLSSERQQNNPRNKMPGYQRFFARARAYLNAQLAEQGENPMPANAGTTIDDHIEVQAAKLMFDTKAIRGHLVLNKNPCDTRMINCTDLLDYLIPVGSTLEIYVPPNFNDDVPDGYSHIFTGKTWP